MQWFDEGRTNLFFDVDRDLSSTAETDEPINQT